MKKIKIFVLLFTVVTLVTFAQQKSVTLEDIWKKNTFRVSYMRSFHPTTKSNYTLINYENGSSLDEYDYKNLKKTRTILSSKKLGIPNFFNAQFSSGISKILLATKRKQIFRHSYTAKYYLYDTALKKAQLLVKEKIQEPVFNATADKIAYAFENNLYIKNLKTGTVKKITTDGQKNHIINGITDWVYEEEFAFVRAFAWNKTGSKIAYLKFNESEVPLFYMDELGKGLYPKQFNFKYPKAGQNNSKVSLHLYDVATGKTQKIQLPDYYYIPRIKWTQEKNTLSVQIMNRHQNNLKLIFVNALDGSYKTILHETDKAYIDIDDDLTFLPKNNFVWTSEKDGYKHLYLYDENGKLIRQLTKGKWEVTKFYGYQSAKKMFYYQSTENGNIHRTVYQINIKGKRKKRLGLPTGINDANFSADKNYMIFKHNDANTPINYTLYYKGKKVKLIKDNQKLVAKLKGYKIPKKEFFTVDIAGEKLNAWMIKPLDFDSGKKYPLLMYQYSGPGSQNVKDSWGGSNDYWYAMLAEKGYIITCVDGRGTGFKGAAFKKMTYKELGKYEVEDQISAARYFGDFPYVDKNRIAIWGWSYGGFMAANCILKGNDVFKAAISVAPVTSWRYYDSVYTERYMRTPEENPSGYDENSPIFHAEKLKGHFLLVHGTGDDNVHVQNAYQMANALIKADKPFDMMIYPDRAHGIWKGKNTRLHLYKKMTAFLDAHLLNKK